MAKGRLKKQGQQEVHHIHIIGQSLGEGAASFKVDPNGSAIPYPAVSGSQGFGNLMLSGGVRSGDTNPASPSFIGGGSTVASPAITNAMASLVPLTETVDAAGLSETCGSGLANWISKEIGRRFIVTNSAVSGYSYAQLKKGTAPYWYSLKQIQVAKALAEQAGFLYKFGCLILIHGEADQLFCSTQSPYTFGYASKLIEWQSNYETDILALVRNKTVISGQIPFVISQQPGFTSNFNALNFNNNANFTYPSDNTNPGGISNQGMWWVQSAGLSNQPAQKRIYLIGNKYHLTTADGLHLIPHASRAHGEEFGKAVKAILYDRTDYQPLQPSNVYFSDSSGATNGNTRSQYVVVEFLSHPTNKLPLVLDRNRIESPAVHRHGFEYIDFPAGSNDAQSPGATTIASVASLNIDNTRLLLTLSAVPDATATRKQIRYAFSNYGQASDSVVFGFQVSGARGTVRDSDPSRSINGYELFNWCVSFAWFL
jgi:hypothetical protein